MEPDITTHTHTHTTHTHTHIYIYIYNEEKREREIGGREEKEDEISEIKTWGESEAHSYTILLLSGSLKSVADSSQAFTTINKPDE